MRAPLLASAGLVLALAGLRGAQDQGPWPVSFVDVGPTAGLRYPSVYGGLDKKRFIIETNGAGVAFVDYDNDGWTDVLVLSGTRLDDGARADKAWPQGEAPTNRLYRNNRDGTFTDVTDAAGLRRTGWASSVCAGDYDNDGWTDLFITYYGQNVLYHNVRGRFEDVTARSGLATAGTRWGSGCTFVDYDRDGKLDLFVANYLVLDLAKAPEPGQGQSCLWKGVPVNCGPKGLPADVNLLFHNEGNGTFKDVSEASGISRVKGRYSMTAAAADLDGDGWTDIYVACDSTAAILYRNNRDGTFTDVALAMGAALSELGNEQAGMGLAVGDFNADGLLDLFKTHFADDIPALYRGLGRGQFEDVASDLGLGVQNRYVEWGAGTPDLDNDGWPDLFYATGNVYPEVEALLPQYPHRSPKVVFWNHGGARFEDVSLRSGSGVLTPHSSRGAAFGDFDNDGDVDVVVMNMNEPPSLLRNNYAGKNAWLEVKVVGTRSNRSAIGATVIVTAGEHSQARPVLSQSSYYSHDDLRLHFGLGTADRAAVEVLWPSGLVERWPDVAVRRVVTLTEGTGTVSPSPPPPVRPTAGR